MKTTLIITDITRMHGTRVCVAGVTLDFKTIRPILPIPGIQEEWLYSGNNLIVRPFALVNLDLLHHESNAPHTEDWLIRSDFKQSSERLDEVESLNFLKGIVTPSVASIFGAEIHTNPGYYLKEGEGIRSLGTIQVQSINNVHINFNEGKWEYHIDFTDEFGKEYFLAVTDLTFRYYIDNLRVREGLNCNQISLKLLQTIKERETYLRVGLTRPTWEKHPHCCFLQITGVYTFPDYLQGKCFADFFSESLLNNFNQTPYQYQKVVLWRLSWQRQYV